MGGGKGATLGRFMRTSHQVCELLVRAEVVTQGQLQEARARAGSADLDRILRELAGRPAWWWHAGLGETVAGLTEHQLRAIRKHADGRLAVLERALRVRGY